MDLPEPPALEEARDRLSGDWIPEVGSDRRERLEYEAAVAKPRMGYGQPWGHDDGVAVEDEVEIERPRCVRERALAAASPLDGLQRLEQVGCARGRRADEGAVQESRLVEEAFGGGVVPRGHADIVKQVTQFAHGRAQRLGSVALVAAERYRDRRRARRGFQGVYGVIRPNGSTSRRPRCWLPVRAGRGGRGVH